jgi:NitT/TauT family transport system ATP-binding protein
MMTSPRKLEATGVWKRYHAARNRTVIAVKDFSVHVNENEFISLIGPSGCGKSTFLRMVGGLEQPSSGKIEVDGRLVEDPGADRGMVFQSYTLYPWLSVFENIRFALKKSDLPRQEQINLVREYIHLVGLDRFEAAYPNQLSGGMRQRVAIARALVYDPQILLMDEPFGALDSQTRMSMQELLLRVWETHRTTVLFVTHDVEEALLLSDRIYVMTARPGQLKAEIAVGLERPRSLMETEGAPRFVELRNQILHLIREEAGTITVQ